MSKTRKVFDLRDVPKFAYPSLENLDPELTAINLQDRLSGKAFLSYGSPIAKIPAIVDGRLAVDSIDATFSGYKTNWKNKAVREVARLLHGEFYNRGRWYQVPARPAQLFQGLWFKPSVNGIWFVDGTAYMVSVNPRKRQFLTPYHTAFLARGMHELHGIDDPNDPIPLVVDLSVDPSKSERSLRRTFVMEPGMISPDEFESIMRGFFEALRIAGIESVPRSIPTVVDIFKRDK